MAAISVNRINVLDNPCAFTAGFTFEITFDCLLPLSDGKVAKAARAAARVQRRLRCRARKLERRLTFAPLQS